MSPWQAVKAYLAWKFKRGPLLCVHCGSRWPCEGFTPGDTGHNP